MAVSMEYYFRLAIDNVANYGDTDIFPFPIENKIMRDKKPEFVKLLSTAFSSFEDAFAKTLPNNLNSLTPVGHLGFRWATQLDPFWNAFLLGIILSQWKEIEGIRIPQSKNAVFSYRLKPNKKTGKLFEDSFGFRQFMQRSKELAKEYGYVLICDIADCYSRIYHHRVENALEQCGVDTTVENCIKTILNDFSRSNSYGVPVGGPAARILVETVLHLTDTALRLRQIEFCRFADDYHIFVKSEDEAYEALLFLSQHLLRNDGLVLQKAKTRIQTASEFCSAPDLFQDENLSEEMEPFKALLNLNLTFDPYSQTAEEDYEALKDEIDKIDLVHLLNVELAKSRIHKAVTSRILRAVRSASKATKTAAASTIIENLESLYPILPASLLTLRGIFDEITAGEQNRICETLSRMVISRDRLLLPELHAAYVVRLLSKSNLAENQEAIASLFETHRTPLIRRDIIMVMANWNVFAWLADKLKDYNSLSPWEQRAIILASYRMGDAGKHFRRSQKRYFNEFENLVSEWASGNKNAHQDWKIPI